MCVRQFFLDHMSGNIGRVKFDTEFCTDWALWCFCFYINSLFLLSKFHVFVDRTIFMAILNFEKADGLFQFNGNMVHVSGARCHFF